MNQDSPVAVPFGFNLYGYLTSDLGLGVAGRNTAHMLIDNHVPVRLSDVSAGRGMKHAERSLMPAIEASEGMPPFAVNLFHINPDQMLYLLNPLSSRVTVRDRMQVCVPFWELPRLPKAWHRPLMAMDLILAPTRYIESAIRAELPEARVVHFPQAVHVPEGITADRARFALPDDAIVFVTSFDMRSDIERKNPWAAIAAFHEAFPERPDVRLVVKVNNAGMSTAFPAFIERLNAAAKDSRVTIITDPMSYRDVLALYASSDVLVSLHRAEGLGLSLLEAMALGKPVVATAFSGNMDFTTAENSCLVGYRMIPVVSSTQPAYGPKFAGAQEWADADVAQAAACMRQLADNAEHRAEMGRRAAATAQAIREAHDRADVVGDVRREYDLWLADPERRAVTRARMRALERDFFVLYSKRMILAALRRAKALRRRGR